MKSIKLFSSKSIVDTEVVDTITLVMQTSANDKGYNCATFNYDAQTERLNYYNEVLSGVTGTPTVPLYKDDDFKEIIKRIFGITRYKADTTDTVAPEDISSFYSLHAWVRKQPLLNCLSVTDKDVADETITEFMSEIFPAYKQNPAKDITLQPSRPMAFAKRDLDYSKTFDWFEKNQKGLLEQITPKGNVLTFLANHYRESFKMIQQHLFTDYNEKGSNCAYICGSKGSGKSTMIQDICYAYHIPVIVLTVDGFTRLQNFFKEYGVKEINPGKYDLAPVESALFYCYTNNLPVVVVIEEANHGSEEMYSRFAPLVSDGFCSVGIETIKANPNLFTYYLLFNPRDNGMNNLYNCDKLYDRAVKINVDKISDVSLIDGYSALQNAALVKRIVDKDEYYKTIFDSVDTLIVDYSKLYPQQAGLLANAKNVLRSAIVNNGVNESQAKDFIFSLLSFVSKQDLQFEKAKYIPHHACDIESSFSSADLPAMFEKNKKIDESFIKLINGVNKKLFETLKGGYPHLDDSDNFAPHIAVPRGLSFTYDNIIACSSVESGLVRTIENLVPNDFSMIEAMTDDMSTDDVYPIRVANDIVNSLHYDIKALDDLMFAGEANDAEYNAANDAINKAILNSFGSVSNSGSSNSNTNGGASTSRKKHFGL